MTQGTQDTGKKKGLDVEATKKKIDGVIGFLQNIVEIIYHALFKFAFLLWSVCQGFLIYFARFVSKVASTFEATFLTAFWVFFALAVCVATLWGWWFMGGLLAERVAIWNIKWDPIVCSWVSLIVGFAINSQQVQTQLWQIKADVASIWDKVKDGKADLGTAARDQKSFLVAKAKKDTQISQFLECFIQMIYGAILNIPLWGWLPYLLGTLLIPEMCITHAARQVKMLDLRLV